MTTSTDLAAMPWKAPEPHELPEWRMRMCEYTGGEESMRSLAGAINAGQAAVFPAVPGMDASPGAIASVLLARSEERRLREAQLYYATADMTSLALAAAAVPPTEPVKPSRLPAPYGFMVFAEPIGGYSMDVADVLSGGPMGREGAHATVTTPIVAVSWGLWCPGEVSVTDGPTGGPAVRWFNQRTRGGLEPIPQHFDGVWLTFYAPVNSAFERLAPETVIGTARNGAPMTAGDISSHPRPNPLTWDNEMALAFGIPFGEPEPDTTKEWAQVVYTAWQLMSQTGKTQLTETEDIPRNRAGRKRDHRAGITGPSDVRIVNVHTAHRPSRAAAEQDAAASTGRRAPEWSCRWPVRPYRRNTCLNPRAHSDNGCEHEDRIVPPHIKGPADKPLKLGETVHLWDHQPEDD
ncbi:hypothetical protein [Nocardia wallacei]|uniref:Uncharacterized protein n=1 Tax=Nocardia wallacei TaxID=480035 RepID=A0A7G1KVX0_9NOCA|nr:hypothetical protein [Nocardia wallacei]BCK59410.1 hypothetical protein NWFMUON74_71820 [Nocardia wallacei]